MRLLSFILLTLILSCSSQKPAETEAQKEARLQAFLDLSLEDRKKPENAMGSFEVGEGLQVELFAAEPMVVNPTNIDVDEKGRVWVCESFNYGVPEKDRKEKGGRIIILEDTDQDGKADKRTLFYQGEDVELALGICVLGNKVLVTRSPDLLVFTDEDGDDQPDKKEKLLTGMGNPGDHSAHAVVFGPDGKLYFNMGNAGKQVNDKDGNIVVDQAGEEVIAFKDEYLGGMVFRMNPDGSDFEVLGHNFRNNYEVAVDSYGNLWQSDNDDDGNKSVRINYILEYGNYGYLDEFTMESWYTPRTGMSEEIPRRHWHQNDPGVVPNILITGAGSPGGILVYEGEMLPEVYRGNLIHADAGPNVVRSYQTQKIGAGYHADIQPIFKSLYDQWSRPIDVVVAPDGSVFACDWYDPVVGGGAAGDSEKGRIFRVSRGTNGYRPSAKVPQNIDQAIEALKNPASSVRFLGWKFLYQQGIDAEKALTRLWESDNQIFRARALWLLGKIEGRTNHWVNQAINDPNPDIRKTGIRLARQTGINFLEIGKKLVNDPAPEVRREVSIGLHLLTGEESADLWSDLAMQYDGKDRWYLEALGIGAENNWDACMESWLDKVGNEWNNDAGKDIIWRARSVKILNKLVAMIEDENTSKKERERYFRAFDFHRDDTKQKALLGLLNTDHSEKDEITSLALQHIDPDKAGGSALLTKALNSTLEKVKETQEFINIVLRFNLTDRKRDLMRLAIDYSGTPLGTEAIKLVLEPEIFKGKNLVNGYIMKSDEHGMALIKSMESLGNKESLDLLSMTVRKSHYPLELRKSAVTALGKSWWGEEYLLDLVKDSRFPEELKTTAAGVLFNVYRVEIREEAAKYISRPGNVEGTQLPPVRDLLAVTGNKVKGKEVFQTLCQTCHLINDEGTRFGPELSEIGSKLSKEGLFRSILYPDEGINYDYVGYSLTLKDGTRAAGIKISENQSMIELRLIGGITNQYSKAQIDTIEPMPQSLMPNLSAGMSEDQLVDLVEYLADLKKKTEI